MESNKQYRKNTTAKLNKMTVGISEISSSVSRFKEFTNEVAKLEESLVAVNVVIGEVKFEANYIVRATSE